MGLSAHATDKDQKTKRKPSSSESPVAYCAPKDQTPFHIVSTNKGTIIRFATDERAPSPLIPFREEGQTKLSYSIVYAPGQAAEKKIDKIIFVSFQTSTKSSLIRTFAATAGNPNAGEHADCSGED